jgi:hypothetical protein
LDLAHISQTSPRTSFATRTLETRDKSSEWPQFAGSSRAPAPDGASLRADRRTVTNPNLTLSAPSNDLSKLGTVSASATPLVQQHPQLSTHTQVPTSRRGSPPTLLESLNATTRSVPATPLGIPNSAVHILKSPATPHTPDTQALNGRLASVGESAVNANDLQASLSRLPAGQYDNGSLTFTSIQPGLDDTLQVSLPSPFPRPTLLMCRSSSTAGEWIQFTASMDSITMRTTLTALNPGVALVRTLRAQAVLRLSTITTALVTDWVSLHGLHLAPVTVR